MKTMTAKYPGKCRACGEAIERGDIIKYYGRWHGAEHARCGAVPVAGIEQTEARRPVAPCWICHAPEGYFRARGAATPVWCDACNEEQSKGDVRLGTVTILNARNEDSAAGFEPGTLASDRRSARNGLSVTRFSSGAVMTRNSRGRCEDAPCCGCCS